ncbi:uncharacterized protein LOC121967903 [Zingiber officinale]|uniref:uncharacterized protein LOC121967903 n=1 Tax=Zingiber officinale TaxID=94328 RepID=UPI001C4AFC6C|nr:uncharacterized protein LOC121967903 [Zingiber officinale]
MSAIHLPPITLFDPTNASTNAESEAQTEKSKKHKDNFYGLGAAKRKRNNEDTVIDQSQVASHAAGEMEERVKWNLNRVLSQVVHLWRLRSLEGSKQKTASTSEHGVARQQTATVLQKE